MTTQQRIGPCKLCEYFDYEGDGEPGDSSMARCVHEDLMDFEITVTGTSSCNVFEALEQDVDVPQENIISDWRGAHKLSI